jgi:hypothetical protein
VLVAEEACVRRAVRGALEPLVGAIPVERMTAADQRIDCENEPDLPAAAARWLQSRLFTASR